MDASITLFRGRMGCYCPLTSASTGLQGRGVVGRTAETHALQHSLRRPALPSRTSFLRASPTRPDLGLPKVPRRIPTAAQPAMTPLRPQRRSTTVNRCEELQKFRCGPAARLNSIPQKHFVGTGSTSRRTALLSMEHRDVSHERLWWPPACQPGSLEDIVQKADYMRIPSDVNPFRYSSRAA